MKQLLVMRHAKSSWDDPQLRDFERPLNQRGERDAPRLGAWLKAQGLVPEVIVCSPARRTRETARLAAESAGLPAGRIHCDTRIYEAALPTLLELVGSFDNGWERVLLIGHNPGMAELVSALGDRSIESFPTCALAVLDFGIDSWTEVGQNLATIVHKVSPKSL